MGKVLDQRYSENSITLPEGVLVGNTKYYARVTAYAGSTESISKTTNFTTESKEPSIPVILYPTQGATVEATSLQVPQHLPYRITHQRPVYPDTKRKKTDRKRIHLRNGIRQLDRRYMVSASPLGIRRRRNGILRYNILHFQKFLRYGNSRKER